MDTNDSISDFFQEIKQRNTRRELSIEPKLITEKEFVDVCCKTMANTALELSDTDADAELCAIICELLCIYSSDVSDQLFN